MRTCLPNNERTMASADDDAGRITKKKQRKKKHKRKHATQRNTRSIWLCSDTNIKGKSTHRFGAQTAAGGALHAYAFTEHMQVRFKLQATAYYSLSLVNRNGTQYSYSFFVFVSFVYRISWMFVWKAAAC